MNGGYTMRHGRSGFEILLVIVSIVAIALFLYGTFGKKKGAENKILVVESHKVYVDLGRDLADLQTMQKEKRRLEDQLKAAQQQVQEEIAAKEAEFGENPTEEQNQLLAAMNRDAAVKMQGEISRVQRTLTKMERQLRDQFRRTIKPIADEIAAEKGATLVLIASPEVFLTVDSSILITDEVVKKMQDESLGEGF